MRRKRVVVTGVGIICSLGRNRHEVWESLKQNRTGIDLVTRFDTEKFLSHIGAELKDYQPNTYFSKEELDHYDYSCQYAIISAKEALEDSGLNLQDVRDRTGILLGTCNGGINSLEIQKRVKNMDRGLTARFPYYQQTDNVAKYFGLKGPVATNNTACAAGGHAIGFAFDLISQGYADFMLAGGTDSLSVSVYAGFNVLQAINPEPCSPYSKKYGLSMGEGAAVVVMESLESALKRGAHIYTEICGYGFHGDAYHETSPEPEGRGIALSIESALKNAGVDKSQIGYINTHGTGTKANDPAELSGLKQVFGDQLAKIPISTSKPYFGHTLGAAAAIEYVATVLALQKNLLPATLHFEEFRSGCEGIRLIANKMEKGSPPFFLCNNSAFGGHNVSIVSRNWKAAAKTTGQVVENNQPKRVVIMGMANINSLGTTKGSILNLVLSHPDKPGSCSFELKKYNKDLYERRMNRLSQFGIGAADLALQDSNFKITEDNTREIGLIFGTSRGSLENTEKYLKGIFEKGPEYASGIHFPDVVLNSTAGRIAKKIGIKGYGASLTTGGNDGLMSTLFAYENIRQGIQKYMLVGAGDEFSDLSTSVDEAVGLDQSLFPKSEGSCFFVLAESTVVEQTEAEVYAEIMGFGATFDGLSDHGVSYLRAIEMALERSGITKEQLDFVFYNTDGRPEQWKAEEEMLRKMFSECLIPIECFNHTLGYSESISSLNHLYIAANVIYNNRNNQSSLGEIAATGDLGGSLTDLNRGLVISSSINGNNVAVVIQKYDKGMRTLSKS